MPSRAKIVIEIDAPLVKGYERDIDVIATLLELVQEWGRTQWHGNTRENGKTIEIGCVRNRRALVKVSWKVKS